MKFCPNYGSPNIELELPQTWSRWKCPMCGYIGPLIVEDGELAVEVRKIYLEKQSKGGKGEG